VHKLKIVFKELDETTIWLEILGQTSLVSGESVVAIVAENPESCPSDMSDVKRPMSNVE